ncbi:MAG: dTDP-4-dehydrorhamnose reductase [Syntrophaceae bacterium]
MKLLVTGALGMLGHDLVHELASGGHLVTATDAASPSACLDITNPLAVRACLLKEKPRWVINCAAFTKVDACEEQEELATRINGDAPGYMADVCADLGIHLAHISTDYVFDGTKTGPYHEDDPTNPINAYGRSKLKGETAIATRMEDYIIIRTQWLFGLNGPNFVATILGLAKERPSIDVVYDQFGCPTYTRDLAKAIRLLIENDARGTFHVCNRGKASWYDLAKKAVEFAGLSTQINPVTTDNFPRPAKRPANSVLSSMKFTDATGKLMPIWPAALQGYLQSRLTKGTNSTE